MPDGKFDLVAELLFRAPGLKQMADKIRRQLNIKFQATPTFDKVGLESIKKVLVPINKELVNMARNAKLAKDSLSSLGAVFGSFNLSKLKEAEQHLRSIQRTSTRIPKKISTSVSTSNKGPVDPRQIKEAEVGIERLNRAVREGRTEIEEFGRISGLSLRRNAAFFVATGAVFGLTKAIAEATSEAIQFQAQLARISQVSGQSVGSLGQLSDEITKLSVGLGVSSKELTGISLILAQADLSINETRQALEGLAKSSLAATFGSMEDTTEGLIAIFNQFDIRAKDTAKALGAVNAVAAGFAVESEDIISAVKRAGGVFAQLSKGIDEPLESFNKFISLFTSIRATTRESADTIATSLRVIFGRLQRPQTIEFFKDLGIQLRDSKGEFIGVFEAITKISQLLENTDARSTVFARVEEELSARSGQVAKLIPLLFEQEKRERALQTARQGQNSLDKDAEIAQQTLANQLVKTTENFRALIREIADTQSFRTLIEQILHLTNGLVELARATKPIIPLIGALAIVKGASAGVQFLSGFTKGLVSRKFNTGGMVNGPGGVDKVPAHLTAGEYVIRKPVVDKIGKRNLDTFNQTGKLELGGLIKEEKVQKFAVGGLVSNQTTNLVNNEDHVRRVENSKLNNLYHSNIYKFKTDEVKVPVEVQKFASGDVVRGMVGIDRVDARLDPGDFVIRKQAVDKIGPKNLKKIVKFDSSTKKGSVPVKLTAGEVVVKKKEVDKVGVKRLRFINRIPAMNASIPYMVGMNKGGNVKKKIQGLVRGDIVKRANELGIQKPTFQDLKLTDEELANFDADQLDAREELFLKEQIKIKERSLSAKKGARTKKQVKKQAQQQKIEKQFSGLLGGAKSKPIDIPQSEVRRIQDEKEIERRTIVINQRNAENKARVPSSVVEQLNRDEAKQNVITRADVQTQETARILRKLPNVSPLDEQFEATQAANRTQQRIAEESQRKRSIGENVIRQVRAGISTSGNVGLPGTGRQRGGLPQQVPLAEQPFVSDIGDNRPLPAITKPLKRVNTAVRKTLNNLNKQVLKQAVLLENAVNDSIKTGQLPSVGNALKQIREGDKLAQAGGIQTILPKAGVVRSDKIDVNKIIKERFIGPGQKSNRKLLPEERNELATILRSKRNESFRINTIKNKEARVQLARDKGILPSNFAALANAGLGRDAARDGLRNQLPALTEEQLLAEQQDNLGIFQPRTKQRGTSTRNIRSSGLRFLFGRGGSRPEKKVRVPQVTRTQFAEGPRKGQTVLERATELGIQRPKQIDLLLEQSKSVRKKILRDTFQTDSLSRLNPEQRRRFESISREEIPKISQLDLIKREEKILREKIAQTPVQQPTSLLPNLSNFINKERGGILSSRQKGLIGGLREATRRTGIPQGIEKFNNTRVGRTLGNGNVLLGASIGGGILGEQIGGKLGKTVSGASTGLALGGLIGGTFSVGTAAAGAGIAAGAGAGAAAGTATVPVLGTAVGAAIGAIIGGLSAFAQSDVDDRIAKVSKNMIDTFSRLEDSIGEFSKNVQKKGFKTAFNDLKKDFDGLKDASLNNSDEVFRKRLDDRSGFFSGNLNKVLGRNAKTGLLRDDIRKDAEVAGLDLKKTIEPLSAEVSSLFDELTLNQGLSGEKAISRLSQDQRFALATGVATKQQLGEIVRTKRTNPEKVDDVINSIISTSNIASDRDEEIRKQKELAEKSKQSAEALAKLNRRFDLFMESMSNLDAVIERASSAGEAFKRDNEGLISARSGGAGISSKQFRNVFENTRGFTQEEVDDTIKRTGIAKSNPQLANILSGSKKVEANLPRILNEINKTAGPLEDVEPAVRTAVDKNFGELPQVLRDNLVKGISSKVSSSKEGGNVLGDLISSGDTGQFSKSITDLSQLGAKFVNVLNKNLGDLEQTLNTWVSLNREANQSFDEVNQIRIDTAVQAKQLEGRTLSVSDRTAGIDALIDASSRRSGSASTSIKDLIEAEATANNTREAIGRATAQNPQQAGELTASMAKFATQQQSATEALKLIAGNTSKQAALQQDLNSILDSRGQARRILEEFNAADPAQQQQILRQARLAQQEINGVPLLQSQRADALAGRNILQAFTGATQGPEGLEKLDRQFIDVLDRNPNTQRLLQATNVDLGVVQQKDPFGRPRNRQATVGEFFRNQDEVFQGRVNQFREAGNQRAQAQEALANINRRDATTFLENGQSAFNTAQNVLFNNGALLDKLNETLGNIPEEIQLKVQPFDVNIHMPVAEYLANLEPSIRELIIKTVDEKIRSIMPNDGPSARQNFVPRGR